MRMYIRNFLRLFLILFLSISLPVPLLIVLIESICFLFTGEFSVSFEIKYFYGAVITSICIAFLLLLDKRNLR